MDDQVGLYGDVDQFVFCFVFLFFYCQYKMCVCVCIAVDQEVRWRVLGRWFAL